ncbi:hypothetical protein IAQ61_001605 [Plenodomus lingam]|uniref:uncharacterized protein n=1 Tax=Leptosphaeria maculans TaxID=5022 RepID=UPI00332460E3|nr:hypothetical protein IAQ61_001605 [Plenodomus lingam]
MIERGNGSWYYAWDAMTLGGMDGMTMGLDRGGEGVGHHLAVCTTPTGSCQHSLRWDGVDGYGYDDVYVGVHHHTAVICIGF